MKGLRLPFERLVRNVWEEGPEVLYDRTKAALTRMLEREVTRREAAAARGAAHAEAAMETESARKVAAACALAKARAEAPPLLRPGLLSFKGKSKA